MNAIFRTGAGERLNFKKTAEVVKYGAGTLKDALDTITGNDVTEFGGNILQTQNAAELLRLLKARTPDFYDEADQLKWQKTGSPSISSSGLSVTASNYLQSSGLVIGGNPFTLEFRANFPCYFYDTVSAFKLGTLDVQFGFWSNFKVFLNGTQLFVGPQNQNLSGFQNFELGYSGGILYIFRDGALLGSPSVTISRGIGSVKLGGLTGTYKFVRISDGICRHTANFTPATPQLDDYTQVLFRW